MSSVCQQSSLLERLIVSLKGTKVLIDPLEYKWDLKLPYALDVETDEKDNCVGIGLWNGIGSIVYLTKVTSLPLFIKVFGHNIKSDWHWLKKWGYILESKDIINDTILMSYINNPTREKHGLKILANEILHNLYPSYSDIVGKGRKRITLNNQPIELTAHYCANDVKATWDLYQYFNSKLTTQQKSLLGNIELPLMKLLFKMEEFGIKVDNKYLQKLKKDFDWAIKESLNKLNGQEINFNSPKQVKEWLKVLDIKLESTDKKFLTQIDHPKVKELLNYRELCKLQSTYVEPLLNQERIHTEFNQLIITGRLSSRNPNLQNIPTKTERGNLLRKAFIPKEGHVFIDADYSQIEYRLLAHFSQEPLLLEAYRKGADIHEETARLLGVSRYVGKTLNFASIYGAQAKKIAQTVNQIGSEATITQEQAQKFLDTYWSKLPRVKYWVEQIKEQSRSKKAYRTLAGQYFPLTGIDSSDRLIRWHAERQAVNGTIQGSAAYIIKLAMLELEKQGIIPILQVHDELLFEFPKSIAIEMPILEISQIMEKVIKLSVPLVVDIGVGNSWQEAKK